MVNGRLRQLLSKPNRRRTTYLRREYERAADFLLLTQPTHLESNDCRAFVRDRRGSARRLTTGTDLLAVGWGVRAADRVVDEVAPPLFESEDMRAGVAGLLEYGARRFRDRVIFQGR